MGSDAALAIRDRPAHPALGPNLREMAGQLVREAMQSQQARVGARRLEESLRVRIRKMPGDQRQALLVMITWLAADLALQLPDEARQATLALCELSDRELHEQLITKLTGLQPVADPYPDTDSTSDARASTPTHASRVPEPLKGP